jgi:Family of unknown function (DUF6150)
VKSPNPHAPPIRKASPSEQILTPNRSARLSDALRCSDSYLPEVRLFGQNLTVVIFWQKAREAIMALIYLSESRSIADFLVCEVNSRCVADLLVCVVDSRGAAQGDELGCYVDSRGVATSKTCFVNSRGVADLLVCLSIREAQLAGTESIVFKENSEV